MPFGWVAAGSAVLGAVGSISAANKQASGEESAAATQQNMFNTLEQEQQPFINAGQTGATSLGNLLGLNGTAASTAALQTLENSPGYQFALNTGGEALTNSMTPGSGALSGATLKSLMGFNQGLASTTFNNYVNSLLGYSNLGESGAAALGGVGEGLGTGIAQAGAAAAGAQAGGIVGATNAVGNNATLGLLLSQYGNTGGGNTNFGGTPSSAGFTGAPLAGGGS